MYTYIINELKMQQILNISIFSFFKITFNKRKLCNSNGNNGSFKTSNESSSRRSNRKKERETER